MPANAKKIVFSSLLELTKAIPDEKAAIQHFTAIRWKNGAFCPYCGHDKIYHFSNGKTHKCAQCKARFSIKVGTIFEDSNLPLRTWMMAVWFISSHKKSIASTQLAKDLGVTQRTAWFMMHRLRHAARTRSFNRRLKGDIEADETFVGGSDSNRLTRDKGLRAKSIVMGMLERNGELRAFPIDHQHRAVDAVVAHVEPGSRLMTDEYQPYRKAAKNMGLIHETVNHRREQYARAGGIHSNTLEGYWSQLKRQIFDIHHWVSRKHLGRYVGENVWRYNRRDVTEAFRFNELLALTSGSRLKYSELIA
jgi:transposase-like protein